MTFEKPHLSVTQNYVEESGSTTGILPTTVIGPRYGVHKEAFLHSYDGGALDIPYPGKEATSVVDQEYSSIKMKNVHLQYYSYATLKRVGSSSNKYRAVLADNIIWSDNGAYQSNLARPVAIGDPVTINTGSTETETIVKGFEADKSAASIGTPGSMASNQSTQSGAVSSASAGSGNTGSQSLSISGSYTKDLQKNILSDTITVKFTTSGLTPTISLGATSTATDNVLSAPTAVNYNYSVAETYKVEIIVGGTLGNATYRVLSTSGTDDVTVATTPALATEFAVGTRGLKSKFTGTGGVSLAAGDYWFISVAPSDARYTISSAKDFSVTNQVFPGYGYSVSVPNQSSLSFTFTGSSQVYAGDYWTFTGQDTIGAVTVAKQGTYTGKVDATYYVEVIQGGDWGVATLEVSSTATDGGGKVTPTASGAFFQVGSSGVQLSLTTTNGGLILGDTYYVNAVAEKDTYNRIVVLEDGVPTTDDTVTNSAVTYTGGSGSPATMSVTGTYDSRYTALSLYSRETYTIVCTKVGAPGVAEVRITSSSSQGDVSNLVTATATNPVEIGKGLSITFSSVNLTLADSWTFYVYSNENLGTFYVLENEMELARYKENAPTVEAWTGDADSISVVSSLQHYVGTTALPISKSDVYVTYRELITDGSNVLHRISSSSDITTNLGEIDKDNLCAYGASVALANSGGVPIFAAYPAINNVTGWTNLLGILEHSPYTEAFRITPMTPEKDLIDLCATHLATMEGKNKWRTMFCSMTLPATVDVISTGTATIREDGSTGVYNILHTTDTDFSVVKVGDKVDYLGSTYEVASLVSSTELKIGTDYGMAQTVPSPIRVYYIPTATQKAELLGSYASAYSSKNIVFVGPDKFTYNNLTLPSYYLAAAVAGLKSSVVPHQPITNYTPRHVDAVLDTLQVYTPTMLDSMANKGVLLVAQDTLNGTPYIRHQVSTDVSSILVREISHTENFHRISYTIVDVLEKYIGKYNNHVGVIAGINTDLEHALYTLTGNESPTAGASLSDYSILSVEQDATSADKIIVAVRIYLPAPINYIDLTITASN